MILGEDRQGRTHARGRPPLLTKALLPTDVLTLPLLLATGPEHAAAVDQLRALGWDRYGQEIDTVDAQLTITPATMTLTAAGHPLLPAGTPNPAAPPGWWEAVDALGSHVVVLVLPHGTDLTSAQLPSTLEQLRSDPRTAQGLVPVHT